MSNPHSIRYTKLSPVKPAETFVLPHPVPWRVSPGHTMDAIMDADDHCVTITHKGVAGRIVGAVNFVECAHREKAE